MRLQPPPQVGQEENTWYIWRNWFSSIYSILGSQELSVGAVSTLSINMVSHNDEPIFHNDEAVFL